MSDKTQIIRSFFKRFGAVYDHPSGRLEDYKSYLMFDCDFTSNQSDFVCSIIPSNELECEINGNFFLTLFSPESSILTTNHHKEVGFETCACIASVGTPDKLAIKKCQKRNILVADYINRFSGLTESEYEWSFPFESGLYDLASGGANFDFWVETAHPGSGVIALRNEWDAFFKKTT
jgi:hypothetical protein